MATNKLVFTGAMALITVGTNTTPIGKIKGVRVTENTSRGRVGGLGTILPLEVPVLQWSGNVTCDSYLIDWDKAKFDGSIRRDVASNEEFEDYLVLQEEGITINCYRKFSDALDKNGLPIVDRKPHAVIKRAFSESQGFDLTEGQIGGDNQSFQYLDPIIFPK